MLGRPALIAFTVLGLAMGSGAALSAPVGLQSLPANAVVQEKGPTVQPVHYRGRRVVRRHYARSCAYPHWHRGFVHCHDHFVQRRHFGHPYFVRRHHYGHPYHYRYRSRPTISFGLSFGRW